MTRSSAHRSRLGVAFSAGLSALALLALSAPARALDATLDNVIIDNGEKGVVRLGKIEFTGTNLTQDELAKLFATATSADERKALVAKLKADKVSIPEAVQTAKDGKMTLSGITATGVSEGKAQRAGIAGIDGTVPDENGIVTIKSGPIAIEGADLSPILGGNPAGATFSRFSWENVAMSAPDKSTPKDAPGGNLFTINMASVTVDATFDAGVMLKGAMSLKGLSIKPPAAADLSKQLAAFGYDKIELGVDYAAVYDPAGKTYSLDGFALTAPGAGGLRLKTALGGIDKSVFTGSSGSERMMALFGGTIGTVELGYADSGLAQKVLAFFATQQQKPPAALQAETAAMAKMVVPAMLPGAANAAAIGEALSQFIATPGALTITLQPKAGNIAFAELMQVTDPPSFLQKVNVDVRAGGATAPAAGAPAQAAPAAPTMAAPSVASAIPPAAPAGPRRLSGLPAWNVVVGNTLSGKNSDGDPLFEFYMANGTVRQLDDDEKQSGKWAFKGGKVCVEYPDDDENCYKVDVNGNTAILTDDDGEETKFEILAGNAKRL